MKRNKIFLVNLLLLLLSYQCVLAQMKIPSFQMPIYFEDAKGNKDSIVVGFDESADYTEIDSLFGEDKLFTPFDSVFDVRIVKSKLSFDSPITGKKRIIRVENNTFPGFRTFIVINAKYNPIKITHKIDLLKSATTLNRVLLSKVTLGLATTPWWESSKDWVCMAGQQELYIDMSKKETGLNWINVRSYKVQGQSTPQKIKCLDLVQFISGPSCSQILDNEELSQNGIKVAVFPNPVQSIFRLSLSENIENKNLKLTITDSFGKIVKEQISYNQTDDINVQAIPAGFYFLQLSDEKKTFSISKFVKID
jgi:Secretion system C-terminal sorting domain